MCRITLFVFNSVFLLSGIGLIVVGGITFSELKDYKLLVNNEVIINLPIISLFAGCLILLVAIFGFYGASKQFRWVILTYILLLMMIIILELVIGIGVTVYKKKLGLEIRKNLNSTLQIADSDRNSTEFHIWDNMQKELNCCGVLDKYTKPWSNPIPESCVSTIGKGCSTNLIKLTEDQLTHLIIAGSCVIAIEVIGIVLACVDVITNSLQNKFKIWSSFKIIMFIYNLAFWLSAIPLIIGGSVALSKIQDYDIFVDNKIIINLPIVAIVAGTLIFLVSIFGICGVTKQSKCMLQTYIALLVVVIILELTVGIGAAVYKNDFAVEIEKTLNSTFERANSNRGSAEFNAWDIMQTELNCCGTSGVSVAPWSVPIPKSCLRNIETGCYGELKGLIAGQANLLIGIGFGVIAIKVVGIIFASCMIGGINRGRAY